MNRMKNKLILGQKQQLNLNQRLTQSIKVLSLSYDEILELIKKEAEENPTLSIDSEILSHSAYINNKKSKSAAKNMDEDVDFLDTVIEEKLDALDILKEELKFLPLNEKELEIAKTLSDNLDEAGYINKNDLPILAQDLDSSLDDINKVLKELRNLNPAGLFAFHLKDSLQIQLRRLKNRNPIAEKILLSCINLLLKNDLKGIASKLEVDSETVEEAIKLIKTLNPKPLSLINSHSDIHYITADLKLSFEEGGRIHILVDEKFLSSIHYEPYYVSLMSDKSSDKETLSYIKTQFSRLKLIKESLEKRSHTLKRVAEFIFDVQRDYFLSEEGLLQVLTLKMIADALHLHESTISRTLKNKYVDTPLGLFELRHFLQKGIRNKNDKTVSKSKIKALIQSMIENESKTKPLSDKSLADELALRDIRLSRRVICKYREEMGIPPSSKRKNKKATP